MMNSSYVRQDNKRESFLQQSWFCCLQWGCTQSQRFTVALSARKVCCVVVLGGRIVPPPPVRVAGEEDVEEVAGALSNMEQAAAP
jgi:hypothetical protein